MADITFKCPECNNDLTVDEKGRGMRVPCPQCGKDIEIPTQDKTSSDLSDVGEIAARVTAKISSAAGVERLEGFSFRGMFSEVFKKHTEDEVERYFAVGGPDTTPSISEVDTTWPKPWVFFRTFVIAFLVYFSLISAWYTHNNIFLVPGIILVGSFASLLPRCSSSWRLTSGAMFHFTRSTNSYFAVEQLGLLSVSSSSP